MGHDPEDATTMHVRSAARGDLSSISWLVERFSPVLIAQAAWRLGPHLRRHCDPEDLVADAWLRLLPKIKELSPRDGRHTPVILKFLSTAILNRVNYLVRKHLRQSQDMALDARPEVLADEMTGVVTKALRKEVQTEIAQALSELDEEDQEIVFLRGIEQRENRTVAELLELTAAAAAMRYHRALKRLRARLPGSIFDELPDGH